jgi:adenylate kinase family enzyme
MDILLMGPPGAGKGTQGAILSEQRRLPKFATGDLLRDAVKRVIWSATTSSWVSFGSSWRGPKPVTA